MKNYELKIERKKIVSFLKLAGKDVYKGDMSINQALWMIRNGRAENECLEGHPDYPICVNGTFYFHGEWKPEEPKEKKIKQKKIPTEEKTEEK